MNPIQAPPFVTRLESAVLEYLLFITLSRADAVFSLGFMAEPGRHIGRTPRVYENAVARMRSPSRTVSPPTSSCTEADPL
jgi:hypothetical protein